MWICEKGYSCVDPCDDCDHHIEVDTVRHGHWIKHYSIYDSVFYRCSVCGRLEELNKDEDPSIVLPYCHCGVKMDEEN
jgi:hypothetical protein